MKHNSPLAVIPRAADGVVLLGSGVYASVSVVLLKV